MAWRADIVPKERYILSMIRKSPFVIAFCLNVLFFLLYLFLGQVKHGSLDDYFMSSVLMGVNTMSTCILSMRPMGIS